MTTIPTNITPFHSSIRAGLTRFFTALGRSFAAYGETHARRNQIAALEAKSDEALARMGLRREDILQYVFRDLYYI